MHNIIMHLLMLHATIILTHISILRCTNVHIVAAKGHLAKFCFDKLHHFNFAKNKNVWVPYKANPQGPKRKWVPKPPPCVFDVGEGSHKT